MCNLEYCYISLLYLSFQIDLGHNRLQTLESDIFSTNTALKQIYLHDNHWHCDCQLKSLDHELRNREIKTGYVCLSLYIYY